MWKTSEKYQSITDLTLLIRLPSLTRFSLKRLLRMEAEMFPLASRMPVSMASLLRSDSVKPFKNSSSYGTRRRVSVCNIIKLSPCLSLTITEQPDVYPSQTGLY